MLHIHTSIVSMHLATRGNNKILRTPPPHISSSEEILPPPSLVAPLPNSEQLNHPFSNPTYTKSTPNHTHIHNTHHLFNCTHIHTTLSPMDLWKDRTGVTALLTRLTPGGPQSGRSTPPPPH